jgi:hypothetical protein
MIFNWADEKVVPAWRSHGQRGTQVSLGHTPLGLEDPGLHPIRHDRVQYHHLRVPSRISLYVEPFALR